MTDLDTLHRAFAELERRADDHGGTDLTVRPATVARPPAWHRSVLVGATAAVLLAGVAGTVALTGGPDRATGPAGGGPTPATTAPATTAPATTASTPAATTSRSVATSSVPVATTVAGLQERFTAALGGLATFTVTTTNEPLATDDPAHDVAIVGVLTTASGASGGYDVQTLMGQTGRASCATDTPCVVTTLADGSTLAVGSSTLLAADGSESSDVTQEVVLVRPDGVEVLLHVSTQTDPKGLSAPLSAQLPLTTAQATAVVTSPAWVTG